MKTENHKITQLGYDVKEYRLRHKLTQQDLANELGVSTNTIHLWETKMCKPSMASLLMLSELLGMPLLEIITKSKKQHCC